MRHLTIRRLILVLAGMMVCESLPELRAAEDPRTTIAVRVYRTAGVSPVFERRALSEAEAVLRAAHVDVRWLECTGQDRPPACYVPRGQSELLLIMRRGAPCPETPAALGYALGMVATVHFNCTARLATVSRTDVAVLLGRVIAHELGHLMMQNSSHARRGLMRAKWTAFEIRRNRAADWAFAPDDVAAMHQLGARFLR